MFATLLDLPVTRPRSVLAATLLVTCALAAGVTRLSIDASIESMTVEGDPDRAAFDRWRSVFGTDEVVAIAIPFEDALAPEALDAARRVARSVEALPDVTRVDALATADDVVGDADMLVVEPAVPEDVDSLRADPSALARLRQRIAAHPIWPGLLVSRDGATVAIQARLSDLPGAEARRPATLDAIDRAVRAEVGDRPHYLAGHPFMKTEISRTVERDLGVLLPVTLGVMAVFMLFGTGSWRAAALTFGGVIVADVWMLGALGWLGLPLTPLSSTAPTILLALGTAYFIHLAAAHQSQARAGLSGAEITRRALAHHRLPTAIAGLTTAIGFASLTSSSVPIVRGFGVALALGVVGCVLLGCFGLPAAYAWLNPPPGRGAFGSGRRFGTLLFGVARLDARAAGVILVCAGGLLVASVAFARRVEVDSSGPNAFRKTSRFRVASEFYRERLSGDVIENVYLDGGSEGAFHEPDMLRRMLAFQRDAEALPEVDEAWSIADWVALMNRAMNGDDPHALHIPDTREAVAQYLLLYSASGDPDEFDPILDTSHAQARIVMSASVPSSRASAALRAELAALVERHFPGQGGAGAVLSTEILLSKAADTIAREQLESLLTAGAVILLLVTVAYRSLDAGAYLLLPNSLPIALHLAGMAILGVTMSDATSIISATALGLSVDGTVHLLQTGRESERATGSRRAGLVEALLSVGRPAVVTSAIVVAGFSVLLLSEFRSVALLGGLTALCMLYCLATDLLVLPAMLAAPWRGLAARLRGRSPTPESDTTLLTSGAVAVAALVRDESAAGDFSLELLGSHPAVALEPGSRVSLRFVSRRPRVEGRIVEVRPEGEGAIVRVAPAA